METPATRREPTTTSHFGVDVTEDYRWLEEQTDETREWTREQSSRTRAYLDAIPEWPAIAERVAAVMRAESVGYSRLSNGGGGSTYVALKHQPPRQQPFLVAFSDLEGLSDERVLVDPDRIDAGGTTAIDFFRVSPDGSRVAVSLSENGTEAGTVHVLDVATGERLGEPLPYVNSGVAGGSLAWKADGSGFWCTRHAGPEEAAEGELGFFQEVAFHDLGTGTTEVELSGVFADDRIAENFLSTSPDGRWVLDLVQRGDGNEWQVFVRPQDGGPGQAQWTLVADLDEGYVDARVGPDDQLYLLATKDTPHGQVVRRTLPDGPLETVVDHSDLTIEGFTLSEHHLWVVDLDGGPSGLRRFTLDGTPLPGLDLPPVCAIEGLTRYGPGMFSDLLPLGDGRVAFSLTTYTTPRTWWVVDEDGRRHPTGLDTRPPIDLSGYEVRRVFATSADGTQVPINLISAPGTGPGAPTLLTAYGGYGLSLKPWFSADDVVWLERGGVLAVANIRGGGEYGVEWHHGGRLTTKQNCFDDFIACADHLVETGVTTRGRLAVIGGSNGGLLMGAVLTQRPDLAAAVVAMVPVMDALRSETTPNGAFNTAEFGTVEKEDEFRALLAYSPYHHVVDGTAYPPVLLTAGDFDPRVEAWHAKKMAARLQAATTGGPVLLRTEAGGHGMGASLDEQVGKATDIYAFVLHHLED
jgi:prolyl oligopeptidase